MKFHQEFGVSAKWDSGDTVIKGKTYWGLSADLEQYMVIASPATVSSFYGGDPDTLPLLFSATAPSLRRLHRYYRITADLLHLSPTPPQSGGSITIPRSWWAGVPVPERQSRATRDRFYAAANATSKSSRARCPALPATCSASSPPTRSWLRRRSGRQQVIGTGASASICARSYVFVRRRRGSRRLRQGSELNLSGITNRSAAKGTSTPWSRAGRPRTGETIPASSRWPRRMWPRSEGAAPGE